MSDLDKIIEELRHVVDGLSHVKEECRICRATKELNASRQKRFRLKQKEKQK